MRWKLLAGFAAALAVAGLVYAWGVGAFYPCGPVDRIAGGGSCRVIASLPATQLQMLQALPSGNLLTATRGDGREPTEPQRLIELDLSGKTIRELPLPDFAPALSWGQTALSPDGGQAAISSIDFPVTVIDVATGARLGGVSLYGPSILGLDGKGGIIAELGLGSFERPPTTLVMTYDFAGLETGRLEGAAAARYLVDGTSSAMSADGSLFAQHIETRGDSGIVTVRLADAAFPDWAGQLLVAPLGSWELGSQQLPELSFSPDGKYLAASFDGPRERGSDNSALIVWRLSDREVVARVPSWNAEWRRIVWLPGQPAIAATRFDLDSRAGEIAIIRFRE